MKVCVFTMIPNLLLIHCDKVYNTVKTTQSIRIRSIIFPDQFMENRDSVFVSALHPNVNVHITAYTNFDA